MRDPGRCPLTSLQQAFDGELFDRRDDRPPGESKFGGQCADGRQRRTRRETAGADRATERGLQRVLSAEPRGEVDE